VRYAARVSKARAKAEAAKIDDELGALAGAPRELLHDLHLLTRAGELNADARRKIKQVSHLIAQVRPALDDALARHEEPVVVDCGAGKSYLGFLLYASVLGPAGRGVVVGVESRAELVAASEERARRYGFDRMRFVAGTIADAPLPDRVHVVVALHACDTATDDALALAIRRGADHVAVVPCCQAEVARLLADAPVEDPAVRALYAHAWHRRELGSHQTNVIRALALQAHGYQVTVTELAGWEHSLKNELIRGRRVGRFDRRAEDELRAVLDRFRIEPALVRALHGHAEAQAG
jgi:hypothetical protein